MSAIIYPETGELYLLPYPDDQSVNLPGPVGEPVFSDPTFFAPPPFQTLWAGDWRGFLPHRLVQRHFARRGGSAMFYSYSRGEYLYDLSADQRDVPPDDWGERYTPR